MNKEAYDFLKSCIEDPASGWGRSLETSSKIIFHDEPWITRDEYVRKWTLLINSPQLGDLLEQIDSDPFTAASYLHLAVNSGLFIKFKTELMPNKELEQWAAEVIETSRKLKRLLSGTQVLQNNKIFNLFMNDHIEKTTCKELPVELEHKDFLGNLDKIENDTKSWLSETIKQNRPNDKSYRKTRFVKKCGVSFQSTVGDTKPEVVAELTSIIFEDPGYTTFQARRILKNT